MTTVVKAGSDIQQRVWDNKLARYVDTGSLLAGMSGLVTGSMRVPDAVVMVKDLESQVGELVMKLRMPLRGSGYVGMGTLAENNGERLRIKSLKAEIEMYGHVVDLNTKETLPGFLMGSDADPASATEALGEWGQYRKDKLMHQALCQDYDGNLIAGGFWGLSFGLNSNIYVDGVAANLQPTYSDNLTTYYASLIAALKAIEYGVGPGQGFNPANMPSVKTLNTFQTITRNTWRIEAPNGDYAGSLPLLLHPFAAQAVRDFTSLTSVSSVLRTTLSTKIAEMGINTSGCAIADLNKFAILENDRSPILVLDTEDTDTVSFVYRDVGEVDQRASYVNTPTQRVFLVNPLLGKGAIVHSRARKWHFEDQIKNLGQLQQIGGSAIEGFKARRYDEPTSADVTSSTGVQKYSGLMICQSGALGGTPED